MEDQHKDFREGVKKIYHMLYAGLAMIGIVICILIYVAVNPEFNAFRESETTADYATIIDDGDTIENGIHLRTGLVEGEGLMEVINNCTNCHSAQLVMQNRMNAERWASTIDWMQKTQNLWDLGENENIIINYLVTNYPVQKKGRRQALQNIEWYTLED